MSCKNTILSCTSAFALSLAMAQPVLAETAAAEPAAAETTVPAAEPAAAAAPAEAPAMGATPPPASRMPSPMEPPRMPPEVVEQLEQRRKDMAKAAEESWEARRAMLNKRYEDLRTRAADAGMNFPDAAPWDRDQEWLSYGEMRNQMRERGIQLPEQPAWPGRVGMSDEDRQAARGAMQERIDKMREMQRKMAAMSAEEREAFREQQYRETRERAASRGVELPETPPWKQQPAAGPAPGLPEPSARPAEAEWDEYRKIIDGMSPEERMACMAMHRMHMQQRMLRAHRPMVPPQGYGPYGRGRGYGPDQGYGPGYGQGYGPSPGYGPGPGRGYGPGWDRWQGYPE